MTSENFVPLIGESRINLLLTFRFFLFFFRRTGSWTRRISVSYSEIFFLNLFVLAKRFINVSISLFFFRRSCPRTRRISVGKFKMLLFF
jgi:hypothetical protein